MAAKQALGRGLKALIPDAPKARSGLATIPVGRIRPNPSQPRHRFDDEALDELAASLREHGVLQPLLVSEDAAGGYVLIAGERRWRAAKRAGIEHLPAVIRERTEHGADLELALVENLQRKDLTPLEEARAYDQLRTERGLSQAQIAERVGLDRSTVANALRLLKLPVEVHELLEDGALSAGHARALLAFDDAAARLEWARRAAETGMSVRDLERASQDREPPEAATASRRATERPPRDPNLIEAERDLALRLGARVQIRSRRRGGDIVIRCSSEEELMQVFERLMETR